jgi:Dual OB-containing domain
VIERLADSERQLICRDNLMARIAILANSKRPDGRCLGGIDLTTGEWVRPVTKSGDGIPTERCFINGKMLRVLDILELDLIRPRNAPEYQKENQFIRNWNWTVKRRLKLSAVSKYIDSAAPILHSVGDRVAPASLKALPVGKWVSLQLIKPKNLTFGRHYYDPNRWVANFQDSAGNSYSLKITDPDATLRLEKNEKISKKSLLTVSMTKPWTHDASEKPPLCYKVVASIIEL